MRKFSFWLFFQLLFGAVAFAQEGLSLHLGCEAPALDCREWPSPNGESKVLARTETLTELSDSDIVEAGLYLGENETFEIHIRYSAEAAARIEKATAENVGKTVALVSDGKALLAPKITEPIRSTSLVINMGKSGDPRTLLDPLPWLKKKVDEGPQYGEMLQVVGWLSILILGILLVGGLAYLVRKKPGSV